MSQLTITPILIEQDIDRHSYLLSYGPHHVLLDPGAHYHSDALLRQIQSIIAIDQIEYIILQSNDFLNISSLDAIINAGFKGTLIVNEASLSFIRKSVKVAFKTIQELIFHLQLHQLESTHLCLQGNSIYSISPHLS
jgi:flavorubredoxin